MRIILAITSLLTLPQLASAHDVALNWKLQDGVVNVRVFFDSGDPGAHATVTVRNGDGEITHQGKTDAEGNWSFPAPKAGAYQIRANAGQGHVATTRMVITSNAASGGPDPGEFAQIRWTKIIIGVSTIAGLAFAAIIAMRVNRQRAASPEPESNSASA